MSWDVVLFNSSQKISSPEEVDETKLIPVSFSEIFKAHFKNIKQTDSLRSVEGKGFTIDYYDDDGEASTNALLHLYGEEAMFQLIILAIKNNLQIFDTALGEMIDLNNPAKNGYKNFQAYLAWVLKDQT